MGKKEEIKVARINSTGPGGVEKSLDLFHLQWKLSKRDVI